MESYGKLGLAELRADAERVLKLNFPNSAYLTGAAPGQSRRWWQVWK